MFLLVGVALALGFLLILLIGATSPRPAGPDLSSMAGESPLVELDAEALGKIVAVLLDKMGIELDRASGGKGGELEILAVNPTPITGGKILVHCVPAPADTGGKVTGLRVAQFVRAVRSARVSKGLFFTSGDITPDGRLEAEDEQVELFDRHQLQRLIEQHLGSLDAETLRRLN